MNEEKKRGFGDYLFFGMMALLIVYISYNLYSGRGWTKDFMCDNWVFYDNQSATDGNKCVLDNCTRIDADINTFVDKCTCIINMKEVMRKCTDKHEEWRFQG